MCPCSLRTICHVKVNSSIIIIIINSAADCRVSLIFCKTTHAKVPDGWLASKLEPEVEFRCQGAFSQIPFWEHFSIADHDIFTKFGEYVENMVLKHVEWSMYARLEYPRWQTATTLY